MSFVALIRDNAVQTVELTRATRDEDGNPIEDSYSGPQLEDPEDIQAVYEPATGFVTTSTGNSAQVESRVLTETEILTHDRINDSVVKRVVPVIDFDGVTIGYEAFL